MLLPWVTMYFQYTDKHTHTLTISKEILHLHHSARVVGIEGASILNHTVFRNTLPSTPKTAVTFETRRDKISLLLVSRATLFSAIQGLLLFFSEKNVSLLHEVMRKSGSFRSLSELDNCMAPHFPLSHKEDITRQIMTRRHVPPHYCSARTRPTRRHVFSSLHYVI